MSATNASPASAPQTNPCQAAGRQFEFVIKFEIPTEDTSASCHAAHKPTRFAA
jgi:hypothetical protein